VVIEFRRSSTLPVEAAEGAREEVWETRSSRFWRRERRWWVVEEEDDGEGGGGIAGRSAGLL